MFIFGFLFYRCCPKWENDHMSEIKEKSAALLNTSKENRSHISYLGLHFTNFLDVKSPRTEAGITHMCLIPYVYTFDSYRTKVHKYLYLFLKNLAKASYWSVKIFWLDRIFFSPHKSKHVVNLFFFLQENKKHNKNIETVKKTLFMWHHSFFLYWHQYI